MKIKFNNKNSDNDTYSPTCLHQYLITKNVLQVHDKNNKMNYILYGVKRCWVEYL